MTIASFMMVGGMAFASVMANAADGSGSLLIVCEEGRQASAHSVCRRAWSDVIIDQSVGSIVLVQHTDTNGIRRVFRTVQGKEVQYTWQVYRRAWEESNVVSAAAAQDGGLFVTMAKPARLLLRDGYTGDTLAIHDVLDARAGAFIALSVLDSRNGYPVQVNTMDPETEETTGGTIVWYKPD